MTTWPDETALVDTNILVYALYDRHEHHRACSLLLQQARAGKVNLGLTPQVTAELFATITNPRRVSTTFTPVQALDALNSVTANLTMLPIPVDVTDRWMELIRRVPVTGADIFDVQLVATMLANGVHTIYTFNRSDFERFTDIEVLTPRFTV